MTKRLVYRNLLICLLQTFLALSFSMQSFSPFPDCTLLVDGVEYSISRHVVASRSKLFRIIFSSEEDDEGGYSGTVQETWHACKRNLSLDLSFSVLMEALASGEADIATLDPRVLNYFDCDGVTYGVILVTMIRRNVDRMYQMLPRIKLTDNNLEALRLMGKSEDPIQVIAPLSIILHQVLGPHPLGGWRRGSHHCQFGADLLSVAWFLEQKHGRVLEMITIHTTS